MDGNNILDQFLKIKELKQVDVKPLLSKNDMAVLFLNLANQRVMKSTNNRKRLDTSEPYESIFKKIMAHTNNQPESELDVFRGIGFFGSFGTGKTLILHTIRDVYQKLNKPTKLVTAYEVTQMFHHEPNQFKALCENTKIDIFIDEIGDEPRKSNIYGNEESVMYRFLKIKLDQLENGETFKIYLTSNLSGEEIKEIYGDRIHSRLIGYLNTVFLKEDFIDKRKKQLK